MATEKNKLLTVMINFYYTDYIFLLHHFHAAAAVVQAANKLIIIHSDC